MIDKGHLKIIFGVITLKLLVTSTKSKNITLSIEIYKPYNIIIITIAWYVQCVNYVHGGKACEYI